MKVKRKVLAIALVALLCGGSAFPAGVTLLNPMPAISLAEVVHDDHPAEPPSHSDALGTQPPAADTQSAPGESDEPEDDSLPEQQAQPEQPLPSGDGESPLDEETGEGAEDITQEETEDTPAKIPGEVTDAPPAGLLPEDSAGNESTSPPPAQHLPGTVTLADYERPLAQAGGMVTLALPVVYTRDGVALRTHAETSGMPDAAQSEAYGATGYDQSIVAFVSELTLTAVNAPGEESPLALPGEGAVGFLVHGGVNYGYAIIADLPVREGIPAGTYAVPVLASWYENGDDARRESWLSAEVDVHEAAQDSTAAAVTECKCCEHCAVCYTEDGTPAVESCACVDEQGVFTYCHCDCPFLRPESFATEAAYAALAQNGEAGDEPQGEWVNCGCPCHAVAAQSIALLDGPLVFTYEELKAEIERDGVTTIYLGYSDGSEPLEAGETINNGVIKYPTSANAITMPATKTSLTIIGTDPRNQKRVTLEDNASGAQLSAIHATANGQTLTLSDVNVTGKNNYGIMNAVGYSGVTLNFARVDYSGVIMAHSTGGNTAFTFTDCNYTGTQMAYATGSNATFTFDNCQFSGTNMVYSSGSATTATFTDCGIYGTRVANCTGSSARLAFTNCTGTAEQVAQCTSSSGHQVSFTNCTFTAAQMAECLGANTRVTFTDCAITIVDVGSKSGEEAAEACAVDFYGNTTITRNSSSNSGATFSVFWLKGSPYSITVSEGATLKVDTTNYLMYDDLLNNATLDVYGTMDVTTRGGNGGLSYADQRYARVSVADGASLSITHQNGNYDTLSVNKLSVAQGAALTIDRPVSNSRTCIHTAGSGASISFANPASVILNNPTGNAFGVIYPWVATSFSFTAPVMNLVSTSFGAAGKGVWNNQDMAPFTVTGSALNSTWTVSGSGLENNGKGASPITPALTSANFCLGARATRFIMGSYAPLTIDPLYHGDTAVSGTAPAGSSQVIVEYPYANGVLGASPLQTLSGLGGGSFSGTLPQPIAAADSRMFVLSVTGSGLHEMEAHNYRDPETLLKLSIVPEALVFETTPLSFVNQMIDREETDWTIQVMDSRTLGQPWQITASVSQQLMAEDGGTLDGSLVFVDEADLIWPMMNGVPVLIAQREVTPDLLTDISWPKNQGPHVLLRANEGKADMDYRTTITWQLELVP